jgi:Holliday junction DNA helicase RuvA
MFNFLRGKLKNNLMTEITVDVGGVGYEVFIPLSTYDKLPKEGEEISLFIHTNVKDDAIQLFGFATEVEKKLFRLLVREVSGVGPKLALNVLSSVSPATLFNAVSHGNAQALGKVSGIGKKTAERIVLELQNKMKDAQFIALSESGVGAGAGANMNSKFCEDAILALTQLGFKYESVSRTVHEIAKEMKDSEINTENLIRNALQKLNR